MMQDNSLQKTFLQLQNLLAKEKEQDLKQYYFRVQNTSPAERRKTGVCWYPVQIKKSSYSSTERIMLTISRVLEHRDAHLFQSGKLVSLFSGHENTFNDNNAVTGVVNYAKDHEMMITLNSDDEPEWIDDGKVGVQLLFDENSYKEMEKGLKIMLTKPTDRLVELYAVFYGFKQADFQDRSPTAISYLNSSQNSAIKKIASSNQVAIVHGPPGTGKTTTLVHAILQTLKDETQVLVCAPSNAAVDVLAEKINDNGIDVVRIGHPARVTNKILSTTLDSRITSHQHFKELKNLRKNAEEYKTLAFKYKRNFGPEEREQRRLMIREAKKFRAEANELSKYIKKDVLSSTRVIATTLVGSFNEALRDLHFSTVFIDEAAQGLEPATWLPIIKGDRIVFAGDHCQLPPTIKSVQAAKEGLSITLFEKAVENTNTSVMLNEQYRMNEHIMNFSSAIFYNNKLKANVENKNWSIFDDDLPLEFIDTAGTGYFEETNPETKSSFNKEEMELLYKHLSTYLDTVSSIEHMGEIESIGIISPYKAQVSMMQETFSDALSLNEETMEKITINTIDSFQGQEKDIIYISLVRSNGRSDIGFLKDTRRMNVAMTRARKKLVIIGDSATIGNDPFYSKFIDYCNNIGAYKSAFEFLY